MHIQPDHQQKKHLGAPHHLLLTTICFGWGASCLVLLSLMSCVSLSSTDGYRLLSDPCRLDIGKVLAGTADSIIICKYNIPKKSYLYITYLRVRVCVCVCVYAYMRVCVFVCVYMCTCTCTRVCTCTCTCTCTCNTYAYARVHVYACLISFDEALSLVSSKLFRRLI